MAVKARNRTAVRTLWSLVAIALLMFTGLVAATQWANPKAQFTPLLGLDLAGGRQIVIQPVVTSGEASEDQVQQAIDIIRRRIDGSGTSEAEVSRLGGDNIAVAIPGNPSAAQLESLSRSSQLQFRPVLVAQPSGADVAPQEPPPVLPLPDNFEPATPTPGDGTDGSAPPLPGVDQPAPDDAEVTNGPFPEGLRAQDGTEQTGTSDDAEQTTDAPSDVVPPATGDPSSLDQITPELGAQFTALNCAEDLEGDRVAAAPADEAVVACATDGSEKYILGPVELTGASVDDATAGFESNAQGATTGRVEVALDLDSEGGSKFAEITTRLFQYPSGEAQNRFAIVLDGSVITAPGINGAISGGQASITGSFTIDTAEILANQIKFGALPISFTTLTSEQISPTLGGEQLSRGIQAGIVGLLLVFLYSLAQYRALGLVTIGSLVVAGLLAYLSVTLLGWATNFRLTMAGVTGLIVAIGITADSFIVYFERVRDEVRAGRPLRYAVDTGWLRARRTILISDAVNLIAAGVLFWLSESSVKAFAFTLGLVTVIDLIVIFMFTHPVVSIAANTKFFGQGHRWSGMDPERLGAKRSTYLGRGQINLPPVKVKPSRAEIEGGTV
ncbi:MAG: protein translocase subunit SecD [Ornithinimicrobium sp.]